VTTRYVETHAHLDGTKFDRDRDAVIRRAVDAGVTQIITVGADLTSSKAAVALAEQHAGLYATVGVHPHGASDVTPATLDALCCLAAHPHVVAIGEIGLDFYRNYAPHDTQFAVFKRQLELAARVGEPIVVHIRDQKGKTDAYDAALVALGNWVSDLPADSSLGVLHCYSGDLETAQTAMDLGFYLGIDGPVTYPNARSLQSLVTKLPLDRALLETDCPYLTPQARRGRRNEPAYIPYIAEKVAELQDITVREVARVTTANARHLFGLAQD
jgi:TatD DNase family protein